MKKEESNVPKNKKITKSMQINKEKLQSIEDNIRNNGAWVQKTTIGWVINGTGILDSEIHKYMCALLIEFPIRHFFNSIISILWQMGELVINKVVNEIIIYLKAETEEEDFDSLEKKNNHKRVAKIEQIAWLLGKLKAENASELIADLMLKENNVLLRFEYARALVRIENSVDGKGFKELEKMYELEEFGMWYEAIDNLRNEIIYKIKLDNSSHYSTFDLIGKKVFISYAGEPDIDDWIEELARKLQQKGIHTFYYEWDVLLGDDIYSFMDLIKETDFTIMVWTKEYIKKMHLDKGGVSYEVSIIRELEEPDISDRRIIPVIKDNDCKDDIPEEFKRKKYCNLSSTESYKENFEDLIRHIFKKPRRKRSALGPEPKLDDSA